MEELIEIYFHEDISMRKFALKQNICKKKSIIGKMHIYRVAIEIYKFLSQEEDVLFVTDKLKNKEWILY